jgi:hypothetical protein
MAKSAQTVSCLGRKLHFSRSTLVKGRGGTLPQQTAPVTGSTRHFSPTSLLSTAIAPRFEAIFTV